MTTVLATALQKAGLRITQPRKAVFDTLNQASHPMNITEIIKALPKVDKVSVYRTIDAFLRYGVVVAIPQGWKQRYELAAPFRPHHHHMQCIKCGNISEIHSSQLETILSQITTKNGFTMTSHTIELTGICLRCKTVDF